MKPTEAALPIDPWSTLWLLARRRPLPDFFHRGVRSLRPRAEQTVFGRVIAEAEFDADNDRWTAVAILDRADADGVHRLLDLAVKRRADPWPTLCSGLRLT